MLLSARNITVRYGELTALNDFSIDVAPGEIIALIGPNGSGKSTALHALAGLNRPSLGSAMIEGRGVGQWKRRELAKRLSFLPQAPLSPENMTVEQLVRQGRFAHLGLFGGFSSRDQQAVSWALKQTGLGELAERRLDAISGGERQRAWIAAALAQEARILLLDEPTSFLDIGHQVEVLELVCRLARERQVAVVLSIHDLNHAMAIADRIVLMTSGEVRFTGDATALARSGLIQKAFQVEGEFMLAPADGRPPHFQVRIAARNDSAAAA
ncbi:iron complex transport system ATP-binding protein [Sinorhizobium fredii]|jgi:iron complex transport system ATP-binding protein|uniref:Iron(3+)-hydroxamate import ATP-binding protein FhuC n=1 Tax=Sinorhizobium fredii (strain USDA 257) TaxID=1185652 RepID=I3X8W3_SINF2|nr:ABC transporter ATP-binding protein [Sinorhizobium fredii]AFL52319.1 iron(3+)-hydroxamate import ATP-binding protein FhuC [Sinorhizobium fredii USDA 257]